MVNKLPITRRDDLNFRVLRVVAEHPEYSQRQIAATLGISLGRANYCLRALVEKGYIKIGNFRASSHKLGYLHVLTPQGIARRAMLTNEFLKRKMVEYEILQEEIRILEKEAEAIVDPKKQ